MGKMGKKIFMAFFVMIVLSFQLKAGDTIDLSIEEYKASCNKGNFVDCSNLALKYDHGDGIAKDEIMAKSLYQKACNGGDTAACGVLNCKATAAACAAAICNAKCNAK